MVDPGLGHITEDIIAGRGRMEDTTTESRHQVRGPDLDPDRDLIHGLQVLEADQSRDHIPDQRPAKSLYPAPKVLEVLLRAANGNTLRVVMGPGPSPNRPPRVLLRNSLSTQRTFLIG